MFNIGPMELLLILLVALVVVGPRRLPEVGRSIGKGLRELRKAQDEVRETLTLDLGDDARRTPRRPAVGRRTPEHDSERDAPETAAGETTGTDGAAAAGPAGAE